MHLSILILVHNVDVFVDYSFCPGYLFAWLITCPLCLSSLSAVCFWFPSVSLGLAVDSFHAGLAPAPALPRCLIRVL